MEKIIPDDIQLFIKRYIGSVHQLKILLITRTEPNCGWNAREVGKAVQISEGAALLRMLALCVKGLMSSKDGQVQTFYYTPESNGEIDLMIEKLKDLYEQEPDLVKSFIDSKENSSRE